jgi:hypothetical protein
MLSYQMFFGALIGIYQLVQLAIAFEVIATKHYRIEKYSMYNCDKAPKNEYVIYNKATMKIYGGRDKIISDGWFEVLQDIDEEIRVSDLNLSLLRNLHFFPSHKVKCFLSRCSENNPTECEFRRREMPLPTVCSKSGEEFKITTVLHGLLQKMVDEFLRVLQPPMECPVIHKV